MRTHSSFSHSPIYYSCIPLLFFLGCFPTLIDFLVIIACEQDFAFTGPRYTAIYYINFTMSRRQPTPSIALQQIPATQERLDKSLTFNSPSSYHLSVNELPDLWRLIVELIRKTTECIIHTQLQANSMPYMRYQYFNPFFPFLSIDDHLRKGRIQFHHFL